MRRTSAALALALALLLVACSDATSADDAEGGLLEAVVLELPDLAPTAPVLGTTPDGLWVAGGVTGGPGTWEANDLAVLYEEAAGPVRSVTLPLPSGHQLAGGSVVDVDGTTVLVGVACPVPVGGDASCTPPAVPVAVRIEGAEAVDLDLAGALAGADIGFDPRTVVGAGAVSGRAVVVLGQAADPQDRSGEVAGVLLDPSSGDVDDADLPVGVLSAASVCAAGDDVYSVVAVGASRVDGVELHAASAGGTVAVDGLAAVGASHPSGGTLLCAGDVLGLHLRSAPGELAVIDVEAGEVVDGPVEVPTTLAAALVATDGATATVTGRRSPDDGEGTSLTDEVTEVHEVGPGGARVLGVITDVAAADHVGVVFDGIAVDVQPALTDPRAGGFPRL